MDEDIRNKLCSRFEGRLGVSTTKATNINKDDNKKKWPERKSKPFFKNNQKKKRSGMEWAELEQISCKVRVIKREMEALVEGVRGRKETTTKSKAFHRNCYQTTIDDLNEVQELMVSLQIGFDRLKLDN